MAHGQFSLMAERRFLPFFVTQALGAFNDNVYKNVLVIIATYHAARYTSLDLGLLANVAAGLFILPFALFSGLAGQLADKFDKVLVLRWVKVSEVAIMATAALGFWLHAMSLLLACVFLMGTHSTFFSPAKYGLLPEVLEEQELVGGNALLEMGTFVAILLGALLAGVLAAADDLGWLTGTLLGIAAAGLVTSLAVPRATAVAPGIRLDWNPVRATRKNLEAARDDRMIWLAIIGISWFWFYGVVILAHVPLYGARVLHGSEGVVTLLLVGFSLGVGAGSLACERLGGPRVELGLVPLGLIGLSLFAADLSLASPSTLPAELATPARLLETFGGVRIFADVVFIGASGGLYIVPLYALLNQRSPRDRRSRIVGANSVWNALFMVGGSLFGAALMALQVGIPGLLLACATLNVLFGLWLNVQAPVFGEQCRRWCSRMTGGT
jgi:MFS family permease